MPPAVDRTERDERQDKERLKAFEGVCIARRGAGVSETFTVRKISNGVGVERIFPVHSPIVARIVNDAYAPYIMRNSRRPGPMLDDHAAYIRQGWVWVLEGAGEARGAGAAAARSGARTEACVTAHRGRGAK